MAARTLALVPGLTVGWPLSTRETDWWGTPACSATSAMTGPAPGGVRQVAQWPHAHRDARPAGEPKRCESPGDPAIVRRSGQSGNSWRSDARSAHARRPFQLRALDGRLARPRPVRRPHAGTARPG